MAGVWKMNSSARTGLGRPRRTPEAVLELGKSRPQAATDEPCRPALVARARAAARTPSRATARAQPGVPAAAGARPGSSGASGVGLIAGPLVLRTGGTRLPARGGRSVRGAGAI